MNSPIIIGRITTIALRMAWRDVACALVKAFGSGQQHEIAGQYFAELRACIAREPGDYAEA